MTIRFDKTSILDAFRQHFGEPARLFRAPARINIIGEHTDYNDGFVMPANADLYTWLAIAPRDDRIVRMYTLNFNDLVEVSLDHLQRNPDQGWQEYTKGVLHVLQEEGFALTGADLLVAGEVPLRSGLSSSAALEIAAGFSMLSCSGYEVDRPRLAKMCQQAEKDFVGVSCGIMDQFVVSTCARDHAIVLDCRSLDSESNLLPPDATFLIVHSGVHRQLGDGNYNLRRRECEQATARLAEALPGIAALRDVTLEQLESLQGDIEDTLYRRARHVVTENERVGQAHRAMRDDDLETLGNALNASHASLRDDFEISCAELDHLVDIATACDGVYGSRMMGGGFGGCTVSIVDPDRAEAVAAEICRQYGNARGATPWHHVLGPTDPVHEVPLG